jgi:hypothetical protein
MLTVLLRCYKYSVTTDNNIPEFKIKMDHSEIDGEEFGFSSAGSAKGTVSG